MEDFSSTSFQYNQKFMSMRNQMKIRAHDCSADANQYRFIIPTEGRSRNDSFLPSHDIKCKGLQLKKRKPNKITKIMQNSDTSFNENQDFKCRKRNAVAKTKVGKKGRNDTQKG